MITRDGLVAEYLFNDNADDTSGNGFHGIVKGAKPSHDRFGNANSATESCGTAWLKRRILSPLIPLPPERRPSCPCRRYCASSWCNPPIPSQRPIDEPRYQDANYVANNAHPRNTNT